MKKWLAYHGLPAAAVDSAPAVWMSGRVTGSPTRTLQYYNFQVHFSSRGFTSTHTHDPTQPRSCMLYPLLTSTPPTPHSGMAGVKSVS